VIADSTSQPIHVQRDAAVVRIWLNRPETLNAMTDEMLDLLLAEIETTVEDPDVRVIVLRGQGRGFCSGGDMGGFSATEATGRPAVGVEIGHLRGHTRIAQLLRAAPAITIAAVNGPCAGAGMSLAMACDLRTGATSAIFRTAFIDAGLSGDFGGAWLLTRLVGEARAKQMYLLNERITSSQALAMGLLGQVHDDADFDQAVDDLVDVVLAKAPVALRSMKANLDDASKLSFADACDAEARRHVLSSHTEDMVEAATAFIERRPPHFTGR